MTRLVRRAAAVLVVAVLIAAGVWTASPGIAVAANNLGLKTITLRIINNTGKSANLFLYVTGIVPSQGNKAFYLSNVNGDLTVVPKIDPPGMSLGLNLGAGKTIDVQLPQLTAARIYFSFEKGLLVTATAEGAPPSSPPGWVKQDPNYNTYFDFLEFTWLDDPGPPFASTLGMNHSAVDMFAFPALLALKGKADDGSIVTKRSGFTGKGVRDKIHTALLRAGHPWSNLILSRPNQQADPLRIVAPYLGMTPLGIFPKDFLDQYINQVWQKYKTDTMVTTSDAPVRTYHGMVVNGELTFTQVAGPDPADPTFKILKPDSETAFRNEVKADPCPGTPGFGDRCRGVARDVGAALMRTTLLVATNLKGCNTAQFYVNAPINRYAEVIHRFALNHLAYAFGYDDTCAQSSFIQVHDPQMLTVTIPKL